MTNVEKTAAVACAWQPKEEAADSVFNQRFSTGELPIEPNRYTLVWGAFCPWATPVAILIDLLKLDGVIAKSPVYALRHAGIDNDWFFGKNDNDTDPILKTSRLSENYKKTDPSFNGRAGVPSLVDVQTGKVVNRDSNGLLVELAKYWGKFIPAGTPDVFPKKLQSEILSVNQQIIDHLSSVIGQIETAASQQEYERLANVYFDQLEAFDKRLANQKYLVGNQLTLSDLLLFVRLVRFDVVYYYKDKLNKQQLTDFPNLWDYAKRLYKLPAFKQNTDFLSIKQHFFQVSEDAHDFAHVVPVGPSVEKWQ